MALLQCCILYNMQRPGKISDRNNGRLTIDELREFKGFENVSEKEGEHILDIIEALTLIIYKITKKQTVNE